MISTYNRARYLPEALDSLLTQSRVPDQMLVIDDGSTDETAAVLRGFGSQLQVRRVANGGKARALNLALAEVSTDYIWIFDDDDVAFPDSLQRHLEFLQMRPDIDFTYSGMYSWREGVYRVERSPPDVAFGDVFLSLLVRNFLQQQGMLVRRRCYQEVGPFAEHLARSQDYEMFLRLARRFRAERLPGPPTFLYRQHLGSRGVPGCEFEFHDRNRIWLRHDRDILLPLLDELEMWEYLPGRFPTEERQRLTLTAAQRRRALLQRCSIALRRGLWDRGLTDIAEAVRVDRENPLSVEEVAIWNSAFEVSYDGRVGLERFLDDEDLSREILALCPGPVGEELRSILAERLRAFCRWLMAEQRASLAARIAGDADLLV